MEKKDKKDIVKVEELKTTQDNNSSDSKVDILSLLGIRVEDSKIEIDLNATKSFFEEIQQNIEKKAQEIQKGIEEGKLDLKDSVGVKIEEDKIELDLNKTKSFLEEISNKFKSFLDSLNLEAKDLSKKS